MIVVIVAEVVVVVVVVVVFCEIEIHVKMKQKYKHLRKIHEDVLTVKCPVDKYIQMFPTCKIK